MKKVFVVLALGLASFMPAQAQWTHYDTQTAISGLFGLANKSIESAERKKQMEIHARQKAEYEQTFKDVVNMIGLLQSLLPSVPASACT